MIESVSQSVSQYWSTHDIELESHFLSHPTCKSSVCLRFHARFCLLSDHK